MNILKTVLPTTHTHTHTKTPTYKKVFSFNPIIEHQTSKKSARCLSIEIFIEKKLNLNLNSDLNATFFCRTRYTGSNKVKKCTMAL